MNLIKFKILKQNSLPTCSANASDKLLLRGATKSSSSRRTRLRQSPDTTTVLPGSSTPMAKSKVKVDPVSTLLTSSFPLLPSHHTCIFKIRTSLKLLQPVRSSQRTVSMTTRSDSLVVLRRFTSISPKIRSMDRRP